MGAPFEELEEPLENHRMLCRGCLADSGEMKDMFEWGLIDQFYRTTNVKVDKSEAISSLLCIECESIMEKCRKFQEQCAKSYVKLMSMAEGTEKYSTNNNENKVSGILFDDRLVIMVTAADTQSKIHLSCPYKCIGKYIKKQDLLTHMVKYHNVSLETFKIEVQYYCSKTDCPYNEHTAGKKWFSGRKFLNQHYNKVHKKKIFSCSICHLKFSTRAYFTGHLKNCNTIFSCEVCSSSYNTNEKLLVHLMRKHPDVHKKYKDERKANKRKSKIDFDAKKVKSEFSNDIWESPKRSLATQTFGSEENIRNDVTLLSWNYTTKNEFNEAKTDEISTQTGFEDLLSLKSQNSEDDSIFFSETVSLSDIQTQTFPVEFGLSRSNKETVTCQTQSPDLSMKETQTCSCHYDLPRSNYKNYDSVLSSPCSINLTSTETQTSDFRTKIKSDVMLSFNSTETQTCFSDEVKDDSI
ncbi:hypothetical protein ACJJTC_010368 [Scirpophaga incertulas]